MEQGSNPIGNLTATFLETNFYSLTFNTFILATMGSAHIATLGLASFWTVFGTGALGGIIAA